MQISFVYMSNMRKIALYGTVSVAREPFKKQSVLCIVLGIVEHILISYRQKKKDIHGHCINTKSQ